MFATCKQVLLKAVRGQQYEIELGKVCDFYHDDYDKNLLSIQLKTLPNIITTENIINYNGIRKGIIELLPPSKALISEVIKLMKLIIVMPATNGGKVQANFRLFFVCLMQVIPFFLNFFFMQITPYKA